MKKKVNNIYDEQLSLVNLYKMWNIVRKTCKNKREIFIFGLNLNTNIMSIYKELKSKNYNPDKFKSFMIFEPKPRLVMSQSVRDKIINHFITNYYLIPYLESKLINSNVATRVNKGSKYANILLGQYFNKILVNDKDKEIYCLKIDISKYFYSIDHELLINMLRKYIADLDVINLIRKVIDSTNRDYINLAIKRYNDLYNIEIPYYSHKRGLSIGAMSSQFLAIFFLNDIDHFIKEKLKCKYYIRYMDDIIILDTDLNKLKNIFKIISGKIENLKLVVNKKSNIYKCSIGFSFIGYYYKVRHGKLVVDCKKKTYYRIKKRLDKLKNTDIIKYNKTLSSVYGYYKQVKNVERLNFKMKSKDIYSNYKNNYLESIVIVKEGIFYKTFESDAIIMWYLFDYVLKNNNLSFGNNSYDKVVNILKRNSINFIIANRDNLLLDINHNINNYKVYADLANCSFNKKKKEDLLVKKVKLVLDKIDCYEDINNFLDSYLVE